MRFLVGFGRFWYDFVIGDDWKIAAAVVTVLVVGALLVAGGVVGALLPPLLALGLGAAFAVSMAVDVRR
jgi:hypothetical protein